MSSIRLTDGPYSVVVSAAFGSILRFDAARGGSSLSLFRPFAGDEPIDACATGCFPLVPFGNRIAGNRFEFQGQTHVFQPNTAGDPLYLHGDGWLNAWTVEQAARDAVTLALDWPEPPGSPYVYRAVQSIGVSAQGLTVTLSVTNRGSEPLPFGLGLHPYFPVTPDTTLFAPASAYWEEGPGHVPTRRLPLAPDLDFNVPASVPTRWVNNGFEGWNGQARIAWPERKAALRIAADALFDRYALFTPGGEYVCLEPMSHAIDAHHQPDGGLRVLAPGETLSGAVRFVPELDEA